MRPNTTTTFSRLAALVLLLMVVAACGTDGDTADPAPDAAADDPETDGDADDPGEAPADDEERRLVVAVTSVGAGDRYAANEWGIYKYATGRLIVIDENGDFAPWLALSWEPLDDTTWQFELRQDVRWHDGEPFTAEDVKYSFDWMLDEANEHPFRGRIAEITEVEVVDDHTVNVITDGPSGALISNIPSSFEVLPAKAHEEMGAQAYDLDPVGIGPYRIQALEPNQRLVLEHSDDHWDDEPYFDVVEFREITEEATRLAALEAGEVDIAMNVSPENVQRIEQSGFTALLAPENRVMTMMLACERPRGEPLCDPRVREAIALAIDLEEISQALYDGLFPVARGHTANSTMFGFNPDLQPRPHDPDRARELLADAGYADGFAFGNEFPDGRWTKVRELVTTIASHLEGVGVTMELMPVDSGEWLSKYTTGTIAEATMVTLGPAFDLDFNTVRFTCDNAGVFFCDEEFDRVYHAQRQTVDQDARLELLHELGEVFYDTVAGVPIVEWQAIWAHSPEVTNVVVTPDVSLDIRQLRR